MNQHLLVGLYSGIKKLHSELNTTNDKYFCSECVSYSHNLPLAVFLPAHLSLFYFKGSVEEIVHAFFMNA